RFDNGMRGFERRQDAFQPAAAVESLKCFGIGGARISDAATFLPKAVFRADTGVVEARGNGMHVCRLAIVVLQDVAIAAVQNAGGAEIERGGMFAAVGAAAAGFHADQLY